MLCFLNFFPETPHTQFADIICFFLSVFRGSVISWVVNPLFIASALAGIYGSCVIATWLVFAHILISSAMIVTIIIAVLVLGFGSNEWTLALIHLPTLVDIAATIPSIVMVHRLRKFNRDRKLATVRPAADVPMEPPAAAAAPVATVATPSATPATTPGVNAAAAAAAPPQPQQDSKCIACMERDRNIVFVPCGHLVMCEACSLKLLETTDRDHAVCPVCRAEITDFVKTFK